MIPRRSATPIPHARAHFYAVLSRAIAPRPITTVSSWADKYRILTSKSSGEVGQWRTDRTPYLREVMDSLSSSHAAQRIVLMFAAQLGKTEAAMNWIGYVIHHSPAPMLVVVPTLEVRKRWVRQRLDPLLNENPVIRALMDGRRQRDAGNAEDMKDFPGGMLVLGGANSPASLSSMPIQYVVCSSNHQTERRCPDQKSCPREQSRRPTNSCLCLNIRFLQFEKILRANHDALPEQN